VLSSQSPNPTGIAGHAFNYDVSQGGATFTDPDGDTLTYTIELRNWSLLSVSGTTISGVLGDAGWIDVAVTAADPHGASASDSFTIIIAPNAPPVVARPNMALFTAAGMPVDYDPTQAGTTFTDPDGDTLTYAVQMRSPGMGLSVNGIRIVGALTAVGVVNFEITASDAYGGSAVDRLAVAVPAAEPGAPTLPASSYVYDDEMLPLPHAFRMSRDFVIPFWDTTPIDNATTDPGATLGRVLFYDNRLSITNTHACGSCHHQSTGFASPVAFSTGAPGVALKRNAMGLANARYNLDDLYFSDRRVSTLETLALVPIEEPTELDNFLPLVEAKLAATDFYPPLFQAAFGSPDITRERIAKALAQFLRSLISYRSRFDEAFSPIDLQNPPDPMTVLTTEELRGVEVFRDNRCGICHVDTVQDMDRPANNGIDAVITDPGVGGGGFRAASLRNIAVTAPYMHDGRFATLREVIEHYDHGIQDNPSLSSLLRQGYNGPPLQLGLSEDDKNALEAMLRALTDEPMLADPKFSDPF
jgi:cytochrome c peroxidase